MKKFLIMICMSTLVFGVANAGVDLTWDTCNNLPGATGDKSFPCDGFSGPHAMFANFQLTTSLANFAAMQAYIDLQATDGNLGQFWGFEAGGCNAANLSISLDKSVTACSSLGPSPWGSTGASGSGNIAGYIRSGANRASIIIANSRTAGAGVLLSIPATTNFYAFHLRIAEDAVDACGGAPECQEQVAVVLNTIDFFSTTAPTQTQNSPGLRDICVRANGAPQTTCDATPTVNKTWGAVKSLYR